VVRVDLPLLAPLDDRFVEVRVQTNALGRLVQGTPCPTKTALCCSALFGFYMTRKATTERRRRNASCRYSLSPCPPSTVSLVF
jgi:hypothetical protein